MKEIYFLNRFLVVSETFVIDQICGLIDRGANVEIISIVKGDYSNLHSKVVSYGLDKKTTYLAEYAKSKILSRLYSLGPDLLNFSGRLIPELIQNGKPGFLVQASSPQEITNVFSMMRKSTLNVSTMRDAVQRVTTNKFNQKIIYDELYTLLNAEEVTHFRC